MIDYATSVKKLPKESFISPRLAALVGLTRGNVSMNSSIFPGAGGNMAGIHSVSFHEGWTYQLVSQGRVLLDTGEKHIPVPPGHLVIIGPSCPNGWRASRPDDRCRIFTWIWRDAPLLETINPGERGWRLFPMSPGEEKQLRVLHEERAGDHSSG